MFISNEASGSVSIMCDDCLVRVILREEGAVRLACLIGRLSVIVYVRAQVGGSLAPWFCVWKIRYVLLESGDVRCKAVWLLQAMWLAQAPKRDLGVPSYPVLAPSSASNRLFLFPSPAVACVSAMWWEVCDTVEVVRGSGPNKSLVMYIV